MRSQRGFTLLEILLVLGLLVVIAAIVTPTMTSMLQTHRLRKSADLLRAEFARTRITAMKEGRIQMFRYQFDQAGYLTQSWMAAEDEVEASYVPQIFGPVNAVDQEAIFGPTPHELPEGVRFLGGQAMNDLRAAPIEEAYSREMTAMQEWSPPILFYPDGTSSDARIYLANQQGHAIEVHLRGITGLSQSGELILIEEVAP